MKMKMKMNGKILPLLLATVMILALLPAATAFADTVGDFEVSWGTLDTDYTYADGVLTFIRSGAYTVAMKTGVTQTTDQIVVNNPGDGNIVNLRLNNVNIDLTSVSNGCALDIMPGTPDNRTNVTIELAGANSLKSGGNMSGLHAPAGTYLNIQNSLSSGSLTANGGVNGAGIGGGQGESAGTISISANVTATGGSNGAGIGGGSNANGSFIYISGGSVTATGGSNGAGIGGVGGGHGGNITITGGMVYAEGTGGQDIGCGISGGGGYLTISGTTQVFLKNDTCLPVSTTTHTHEALAGAHEGDVLYGGVTLPWDGDYGAYLRLYTLTYDANGGEGTAPASVTRLVDTTAVVADGNGMSRTGYIFDSWNTQADGYDVGYIPGDTFTFNANTTLYAQWSGNWYTVTFDAQGGSFSGSKTVICGLRYGELPTPEKTSYVFNGWYMGPEGSGTHITAESFVSIASDHTLYAMWAPRPYNITYDLAGGENSPVNPESYTIESPAITLASPTKTGCTFAGWSGTDVAGTSISVTIPAGSMGDRTYAAHWTPIVITGLPAAYTMYTNGRVTWDPKPDGGTWDWDETFFSATFNSPATFTALRAGTSAITYSAGGASQTITVTIRESGLPSTGQDFTLAIWLLNSGFCIGLCAICGLIILHIRKRRKERA